MKEKILSEDNDKNDIEHQKKQKTTNRFLIVSLIVLIAVCIGSLSFFALHMRAESEEAINNVGDLYMHGLSERISDHFETTINFRMDQIDIMLKNTPPEKISSGESSYEFMKTDGKMSGFTSMSLYCSDGHVDTVYGSPVTVTDPEPFFNSLNNGEKKVAVATNDNGDKLVLLATAANYPMSNGETSTAIVVSIPVNDIKQILSLEEQDSLTYSHIIRRDGSYVIRSVDQENDNYFTRIMKTFSELNGKHPEHYVAELKEKMEKNEEYAAIMMMNNERRHLYCTKLPHSEWYLVTVMPYGQLDTTVNGLTRHIIYSLLISLAIIMIVLAVIFSMYFSMSQKQIHNLEQLRHEASRANKAKSEFLSNMSHDIRTPMNAIVGMTAIAAANIDDKMQVQNSLKKISLSSKHLLGLINDILDMSKIESGKLTLSVEQISLREVVDGIVNIVQPQIKAKNQKFDVFIHDIENENVYCDSVRLNQVLLNLLSNAIKFTPDEGSISLSLYEKPSPKGDNFVRIHVTVKDTGIGMTEEFKEKIFESFAREDNKRVHKTEGSGLGMAITKYIVDAMDGTIDVQSELGKGTEFNVVLDFEQSFIHEEDMVLPNWNMLVVDDDEQLCQSTVASLKSIGIKADWTLDGESAVKLIAEHHKKHTEYHIILLDWKLPGIDGIETARRIRRQLETDIPILLISAYDWSEIEHEARDAGINGFIPKPLFKSTLYLGLKQFADGAPEVREEEHEISSKLRGARILVAEDNELNWEIASELLSSQLGLIMERAENGKICVDKFTQSEAGYYDAILMDIRMPVMTGYEATEAIRKLDRSDSDLPIIAMTADAFSEDVKKCLDCGMNAHVAKPIDTTEVKYLLEKFLK